MVNLNMIDPLGDDIYMINTEQYTRHLLLSDYILNKN